MILLPFNLPGIHHNPIVGATFVFQLPEQSYCIPPSAFFNRFLADCQVCWEYVGEAIGDQAICLILGLARLPRPYHVRI